MPTPEEIKQQIIDLLDNAEDVTSCSTEIANNLFLYRYYPRSGMHILLDVHTDEFSNKDKFHIMSHIGVYEEHRIADGREDIIVDFDVSVIYVGY